MKLTWTNTEWDNFSGVASQDNLLMLNAGDEFLNASGDGGNAIVDRNSYKGLNDSYGVILRSDNITTSEDLNYLQNKLAEYKLTQSNIKDERDRYSVSRAEYIMNSDDANKRADANKRLWTWDNVVSKTKDRIEAVTKILEAKAKAKEEADAKAKAKAEAEAKAKEEADKRAKIKELNNQLVNAKTPEEKSRIQAEIDALVGNVAKGASNAMTYVVVGVLLLGGAYLLFRRKAS